MKDKRGCTILIILQLFVFADNYLLRYLDAIRSTTYTIYPYMPALVVSYLLFGILMGMAAFWSFRKENMLLMIILLLLNIAAVIIGKLYFFQSVDFYLILAGILISGIINVKIKNNSKL